MAASRELGERTIIVYKTVKGAAQIVLAAALAIFVALGYASQLVPFAETLRHHGSGAWSVHAAQLILSNATPRRVELTAIALLLDGVLSTIEGWALRRGHWWGPWLVVVATSSLLPFEVLAIARHPHFVRIAMFVLNLAIVVYLGRKAWLEHRRRTA